MNIKYFFQTKHFLENIKSSYYTFHKILLNKLILFPLEYFFTKQPYIENFEVYIVYLLTYHNYLIRCIY